MGPQHRPQYTIVLIMGTPKMVPLILGNPHIDLGGQKPGGKRCVLVGDNSGDRLRRTRLIEVLAKSETALISVAHLNPDMLPDAIKTLLLDVSLLDWQTLGWLHWKMRDCAPDRVSSTEIALPFASL